MRARAAGARAGAEEAWAGGGGGAGGGAMERNVARLFRERAAPPSEAHFTQAGLLAGALGLAQPHRVTLTPSQPAQARAPGSRACVGAPGALRACRPAGSRARRSSTARICNTSDVSGQTAHCAPRSPRLVARQRLMRRELRRRRAGRSRPA